MSDSLIVPSLDRVEAMMAEKQNTVDDNLNTTDKTIVGAINEILPKATGVGKVDLNSNGTGEIFNSYELDGLNVASGIYSHAEGYRTTAEGDYSHAEGFRNNATGTYSHAEGINTNATGTSSHAEGSGNRASGSSSHAEGSSTTASGYYSHAEGSNTQASGTSSHAEGSSTTASGYYSHAEGSNTQASGTSSHAEGGYTEAFGNYEHSEGTYNKSYDSTDVTVRVIHTVGIGSAFNRKNAHEIKFNGDHYIYGVGGFDGTNSDSAQTLQEVINSTAAVGKIDSTSDGTGEIFNSYEGVDANRATGNYSHAEGSNTRATGNYSHAEGSNTRATGNYSHAEGYRTTAEGIYSHAEGEDTKATGSYSHAEGSGTKASGTYSHAEGASTTAFNRNEHAEGDYNVSNTGNTEDLQTRHSVGIGSADSDRKNAHEIMANGDHYIYGLGGYDGTNATNDATQTLQEVINSASILNKCYICSTAYDTYPKEIQIPNYDAPADGDVIRVLFINGSKYRSDALTTLKINGGSSHYIVANSFFLGGGNGPIFNEWQQDLILELVFYENQWLTVGNPMVYQYYDALSTNLFRHTKIFANKTCSVDFYQDAGTNLHFPFKFPLDLTSDRYGPYVTVARDLNNVATDISAENGVYSIAKDEVVVELGYNINSNKRGYIHVEGVCE